MGSFRRVAAKLVAAVQTQAPPIEVQSPPVVACGTDDLAELEKAEAAARIALDRLTARRKAAEEQAGEQGRKHAEAQAAARRSWPADKPMPQYHVKARRAPQPCPECRRIYLDDGGQVAVCVHSDRDSARFRCRYCENTWILPVKLAD